MFVLDKEALEESISRDELLLKVNKNLVAVIVSGNAVEMPWVKEVPTIVQSWYAMNYGFEAMLDTPGNVAGLGRFDELLGCTIFDSIYGRNANVFAAVPSLHAAYMVVALAYAIMNRCKGWLIALFAFIMVGIWCTAVYSGHHYLIDVLLGIFCALLGIFVFEKGLMKWGAFKRFFERYSKYIR